MNAIRKYAVKIIKDIKYHVFRNRITPQMKEIKGKFNADLNGYVLYKCKEGYRMASILYISFLSVSFFLATYLQNLSTASLWDKYCLIFQIVTLTFTFIYYYKLVLKSMKRMVLLQDGKTVLMTMYKQGCIGERHFKLEYNNFVRVEKRFLYREITLCQEKGSARKVCFYSNGIVNSDAFNEITSGKSVKMVNDK